MDKYYKITAEYFQQTPLTLHVKKLDAFNDRTTTFSYKSKEGGRRVKKHWLSVIKCNDSHGNGNISLSSYCKKNEITNVKQRILKRAKALIKQKAGK